MGISSSNWAISDKAESCSALRGGASPNGGWSEGQLTDSGRWVRNTIRGGGAPSPGGGGDCDCDCSWASGATCGLDDGSHCHACCCASRCNCDCSWASGATCGYDDGSSCHACCCSSLLSVNQTTVI